MTVVDPTPWPNAIVPACRFAVDHGPDDGPELREKRPCGAPAVATVEMPHPPYSIDHEGDYHAVPQGTDPAYGGYCLTALCADHLKALDGAEDSMNEGRDDVDAAQRPPFQRARAHWWPPNGGTAAWLFANTFSPICIADSWNDELDVLAVDMLRAMRQASKAQAPPGQTTLDG